MYFMAKMKHITNDLVASDADADFEIQVAEILGKLGDTRCEWVSITQQQIFPCEANIQNSKESLIGDMANALTCHCLIAAIYHQGRQLSDAEIAPLTKEALEILGPISRARADGLF